MATQKILYIKHGQKNVETITELLPAVFDCSVDSVSNGFEDSVSQALAGDYTIIIIDVSASETYAVNAAKEIKSKKPQQIIVSISDKDCLPEGMPADAFVGNFRKSLPSQLKEFGKFCRNHGIDLQELK